MSRNNPTGFPQVLRTLPVPFTTRDAGPAPAQRLSKGRRPSPGLWTRLIAQSGSCSGQAQVRLSEKATSNPPSPPSYLRLAHCPFVNACWGRVKIRRLLHYDASSCMKVYFKESLAEGRGLGRTGPQPEDGRFKGRLRYLEKSRLQNKTVLYLQRKTHSSFPLVAEKATATEVQRKCFVPLIAFHIAPLP